MMALVTAEARPRASTTGAPAWLGPRLLLAASAGVLIALAFPPYGLLGGWLAVPAFAMLVATFQAPLQVRRQRKTSTAATVHAPWRLRSRYGALLGAAAGLGFFLVLLDWLRVLGADAWILLSLVCAAFWAGAGALLPRLLAARTWVLCVPLLWVCVEAARARVPFGGFPWGRLAFAQADTSLRGWASLGGPALVTFVVALSGCLLLASIRALSARRSGAAAIALVGMAILGVLGAALLQPTWGGAATSVQPIAIVQGNVPRLGLDFNAQRRAVLDNHVRATEALAAEVARGTQQQPVAVVWPENSSDIDPLRAADARAEIDRAAAAIGVPILVGTVLRNPDDPATVLNVSIVWDPQTGPGDRYVKRHPVPFGEYLPFRGVLTRFITRFDRIPRDFVAGSEVGVLQLGPVQTGVVICFEIAYDELIRDAVGGGGQVLMVQTNNATYGHTGQPEQQLAITRIQAVASGRTTLVAATSGISAVVDERGALRWRTEEFTAQSTVADVPLRGGLTPAVRLGSLPELAALIALIVLVVTARRHRQAAPARVGDGGATASEASRQAVDPPVHGTLDQ